MEKHTFILYNLKNNTTVNHSLILIKGFVKNCGLKCNLNQLTFDIGYQNCKETFITICKRKTFTCIIELMKGENIVHINCDCSSVSVMVNFKPSETIHTILPIYIICDGSDGKFQSPSNENNSAQSACDRILLGCKILQLIFAELLQKAGYPRKTFSIDSRGCYIFHSTLHYTVARKMNQFELWNHFAQEIIKSPMGNCNTKYLVFLSCTYFDSSKFIAGKNVFEATEGYVAYGGGGLALLGTACLYTWPEHVSEIVNRLEDFTEVDNTKFMDDSSYRGTKGGCLSTTLGSALHELCHTLDLGHTQEGIMGRGFNNIQDFFLKDDYNDDRNQNTILKKYRTTIETNEFFWTKSCCAILNYHKWLNNYKNCKQLLKLDSDLLILKSLVGIRVVELRTVDDEMVKNYWIFDTKVLKYQFQIPTEEIVNEAFVIFCIDNVGNTLKHLQRAGIQSK